MKTVILRYIGFLGCAVLILVFSSCNLPDDVMPRPVISITNPNPNLWNESITGTVQGIFPNNYKIAVYGKIDLGWYNLPNRETPVLSISGERDWACPIAKNQISVISAYTIYLIPNGYSPPILVGAKILPVKLNLVSVARTTIQID